MQWLQGPNQSNIYNLNNVRREAYRHFRSKWKEYLQAKIHKLGPNSKIKKIRDFQRGINDFKKGYQPRTNTIKEKGDLITDSYSILDRWRNHLSQQLNVHGADDRQTEIHKAKSLVSEPSVF